MRIFLTASKRLFGRAWRERGYGSSRKINASADYRELSANFGTPSNSELDAGQSTECAWSGCFAERCNQSRHFGMTYTFLDNNVHPTTTAELRMNSFDETWSKALGVKANLSVDARSRLPARAQFPRYDGMPPAQTGAQDLRDLSGSITFSRTIGTVQMNAGARATGAETTT